MPTIFDPIDLTTVPLPKIIDTPEFETIYQEMLVQFQAILPEYQLLLESDPVVKVIQAFSYRELLLRNRLNQVAQSNLLPFATGEDLDNLAAFYNLKRMQITPPTFDVSGTMVLAGKQESDDDFRYRIQSYRMSTAGPAAHYRFQALSAHPMVKQVAVYSPDFLTPIPINMGGKIYIAIMSHETGGIPTEPVLQAVRERVARDDVKVLTDIVEVIPSAQRPFDVVANITLYPNVSRTEIDDAVTRLQTAFDAVQAMGRDITLSWLMTVINSDRIQGIDIVQPVANVIVAPNEFAVMSNVTLNFAGYSDAEGYGVVELDTLKAQREVNRLYVAYAIENKRTQVEILTDLIEVAPAGVISPTLRGLAEYLNLLGTKDTTTGEWLPDAEIAFLIWRNLSAQYAST